MNNLKNAVGLLNAQAPEGEFLAYINPDEAQMLKDAGGAGLLTPQGIPSYFTAGQRESRMGGGSISPGTSTSGGMRDSGGNDNNNNQQNPNIEFEGVSSELSPYETGMVDAEDEYLAPDKDHWKATQKAIKELNKTEINQSDWDDWSKEAQDTYQLEMNKLKGTEGKNYSFYKGNEGTTNLSFSELWKAVPATNPVLANIPIARLLIAAGRTLQENFTTDYGTARYGGAGTDGSSLRAIDGGGWLGMLFNSDGTVKEDLSNDDYDRIYNAALPDLPYLVGGSQPQETSMVNEYFANTNNQNLGISSDYMTTYNKAKEDLAKTLNMTANADQFGYSGTMTASNIYYNYLKEQGLL